jgi:6-hydroxynicotinate reductase
VCPQGVLSAETTDDRPACTACPIQCRIPEGSYGACKRYYCEKGAILRKGRVHTYEEVKALVASGDAEAIGTPLITGIGSGTTYPDFIPSPFIVSGVRDGVDVVTVVTEAPLSYSGMKLKADTDLFMGQEGKKIYVKRKGKRHVGHLCTEEYGSKMFSLGGVNILTSKDGQFAARTIMDLLQGKKVKFEVEDGSSVEIALGKAPAVNGESEERMRVGCGSATSGLFAPYMLVAADEVIVLDGHITALFSEHPAGKYLKKPRSCITIKGQKSTDGRYFLEKGDGWGGTNIQKPLDVIKDIDKARLFNGMTLLITETTGQKVAFFRANKSENNPSFLPPLEKGGTGGFESVFEEQTPTTEALKFIEVLKDSCQPSSVSAIFAAGVGGSARAGVTKNPIKLTRAVHEGKVAITIGGARPFIFPGGGINFLVDVAKIKHGSIYLSPTPSFVIPVEYTMTLETFKEIGGHIEAVRPVKEVLKRIKSEK